MVRLFRVPTDEGHGAAPTNLNLTQRQYENDVSSSTSPWLALQAQRLSVAVHIASAELRRGRSATEMCTGDAALAGACGPWGWGREAVPPLPRRE